ncbi:MAG TPA: GMC family oxidoreductase [Chitinophagaceae bacterium]|nr:GMC family oxidoreductase [Chitinophagaceae bacterium]
MHIDARNIEDNSVIEGDICIVGAGAAGISMALDWMNTPYKVILLEGGGFDYDPQVQDLYAGKTTGQKYFPLVSCRLHYFGGTTGHWAGYCSPFDEIDFKKRDWIPLSGWPITRKDLDQYYAKAQPLVDLGPYDYSVEYWQKQFSNYIPLNINSGVIWNKMWQFSPPTRFGTKYRDTIVKAKNIHLYTYANVVDITANSNVTAIDHVTVKNFAGKQHTVKAKQFVLACCSIQNARILLASNKQATKGLGNDNDNVGRHFMEHIEIKSGELWLDKPDSLDLYMNDFVTTKARAELAVTAEKQEEYKILNGTMSLSPLQEAKHFKSMIESWSNDVKKNEQLFKSFDDSAKKTPGKKTTNSFELFTRIEQAPNPDSRVTLDTEKDALGMPRAQLHWVLTQLEKRSIRKIHELIGQEVGKTGAGRVKLLEYLWDEKDESWPRFTGGGWHHMGTTRMSDNPKTGVVDANCKVHGIANLHIAGASCYATAAAPNPTLTVIALTLRLSNHLKSVVKV